MSRFTTGGGSAYFKPKEHENSLVLFEPRGLLANYQFPGSNEPPRDAMRCNVFVLGDNGKATKFYDQTVTQSVLVSAMRQADEPYVLGRLTMGKKAWLFGAPTADDEARAEKFLDDLEGSQTPAEPSEIPF